MLAGANNQVRLDDIVDVFGMDEPQSHGQDVINQQALKRQRGVISAYSRPSFLSQPAVMPFLASLEICARHGR